MTALLSHDGHLNSYRVPMCKPHGAFHAKCSVPSDHVLLQNMATHSTYVAAHAVQLCTAFCALTLALSLGCAAQPQATPLPEQKMAPPEPEGEGATASAESAEPAVSVVDNNQLFGDFINISQSDIICFYLGILLCSGIWKGHWQHYVDWGVTLHLFWKQRTSLRVFAKQLSLFP